VSETGLRSEEAASPVSRFLDLLDFHMGEGEKVILDTHLRFEYQVGVVVITVTVPAGFVNDLASVPRALRSLAPPWQQSARSGVLHDYLYRTALANNEFRIDRLYADQVFRAALRSEGVSRFKAWAMYKAVRWFAGRTWDRYRGD